VNVRLNELTWPNLIHITTPVLRDLPGSYPWWDLFNWYVPIDDETSALFSARNAPLRGELAAEFERRLPPHRAYNPADEARAVHAREGSYRRHRPVGGAGLPRHRRPGRIPGTAPGAPGALGPGHHPAAAALSSGDGGPGSEPTGQGLAASLWPVAPARAPGR